MIAARRTGYLSRGCTGLTRNDAREVGGNALRLETLQRLFSTFGVAENVEKETYNFENKGTDVVLAMSTVERGTQSFFEAVTELIREDG